MENIGIDTIYEILDSNNEEKIKTQVIKEKDFSIVLSSISDGKISVELKDVSHKQLGKNGVLQILLILNSNLFLSNINSYKTEIFKSKIVFENNLKFIIDINDYYNYKGKNISIEMYLNICIPGFTNRSLVLKKIDLDNIRQVNIDDYEYKRFKLKRKKSEMILITLIFSLICPFFFLIDTIIMVQKIVILILILAMIIVIFEALKLFYKTHSYQRSRYIYISKKEKYIEKIFEKNNINLNSIVSLKAKKNLGKTNIKINLYNEEISVRRVKNKHSPSRWLVIENSNFYDSWGVDDTLNLDTHSFIFNKKELFERDFDYIQKDDDISYLVNNLDIGKNIKTMLKRQRFYKGVGIRLILEVRITNEKNQEFIEKIFL